LPALERVAATPDARRDLPLDREVVAFIAARDDQRLEPELVGLADATPRAQAVVLQLRVLAALQRFTDAGPLPGLASWLAEQASPTLEMLRNRARRKAAQQSLATFSRTGQLAGVLGVVANPTLEMADAREAEAADAAVRRIDAELVSIAAASDRRAFAARRIGQDLALVVGTMALTVAFVAIVMGSRGDGARLVAGVGLRCRGGAGGPECHAGGDPAGARAFGCRA
jgi:hypothetical protein